MIMMFINITMFELIIYLLYNISLARCGESNIEVIVIKSDDNTVLVAGNLSMDRYKELKDETSSDVDMFEAAKQEVRDTEGDIDLVDFTYDNANKFESGNEVSVWRGKHIGESFPEQAEARKISLID